MTIVYHIVFITRRALIVSLIIFSKSINVFQAIGFLSLSTFHLIYLIKAKPFNDPAKNKQEIVNESLVYTCSYLIFAVLNSANSQELRDTAGWIFIAVCLLSMAFNLSYVLYDILLVLHDLVLQAMNYLKMKKQGSRTYNKSWQEERKWC